MNNFERTCDMVNAYVKEYGRKTEMGRGEFIEWVHEKYENISVERNNMYPADISFNLYNKGLIDFPGPCICLMYVFENDKFRLVGTDYKPTCNVIQYKGRKNEQVVGKWNNGDFHFLPTPIPAKEMD